VIIDLAGVVEELEPFFNPRSVAIVGATIARGPGVFNVMENLISFGYKGEIYPVNPKYTEVLGKKAYKSVKEIPGPVDLVLIAVGRAIVPSIVKECAEKGVKSVIIVTQGFAEADEEGNRVAQAGCREAYHYESGEGP
jgi:acetyltransferase